MAFCADVGFRTGDPFGTAVVGKMIGTYFAVLEMIPDLLGIVDGSFPSEEAIEEKDSLLSSISCILDLSSRLKCLFLLITTPPKKIRDTADKI